MNNFREITHPDDIPSVRIMKTEYLMSTLRLLIVKARRPRVSELKDNKHLQTYPTFRFYYYYSLCTLFIFQ